MEEILRLGIWAVFGMLALAIGWIFNLICLIALLKAKTPVSRRLVIATIVPFGVWVFALYALAYAWWGTKRGKDEVS